MPKAVDPTKKKVAPKRKKAANGYQLPEKMPLGEILTDVAKNQWKLGPSIGSGGFGEIYSACQYKSGSKENYNYVVKIEPHGNGPLFVEMHFYMRNAKKTDIADWMKSKGLTHLGMPRYIGSGSHETKSDKYRFVVMERFGKDLWTIFLESGRQFPVSTVCRVGYQVLNALEYIHSRGYVHADIKGANILLDVDSKLHYQTYLVDFGLAAHFTTKDFKHDPRKAHNGTIEYTSRDAHDGVLTRRGDIEILAYNLLQWLGNKLPWEKDLTNPVNVQKEKIQFFKTLNLKKFQNVPDSLIQLFKYVQNMNYDTEPDYAKIRSWLLESIKNDKQELIFTTSPQPKTEKSPKAIKRKQTKSTKEEPKKRLDNSTDSVVYASPEAVISPRIKPTPRKLVAKKLLSPKTTRVGRRKVVETDSDSPSPIKRTLKVSRQKVATPDSDSPSPRKRTPKALKSPSPSKKAKIVRRKVVPKEEDSEDESPKRTTRKRPAVVEEPESDISDTEKMGLLNISDIENNSGTPNTGSKFHPKNIRGKKTPTPKRKVLKKLVSPDSEGDVGTKKVRKVVVKKSTKSWRDCPTIQNGRGAK